jgi:hypothetical protein
MAVDAERAESDRRLAAEKMLGAQVERELEQGWQATVGELEHAQAELLAHQMGATRAQVSTPRICAVESVVQPWS